MNRIHKIAFYAMNAKGYFTIKKFIEEFGANSISYIVSSRDAAVKGDFFEEIKEIARKSKVTFFDRTDNVLESKKPSKK